MRYRRATAFSCRRWSELGAARLATPPAPANSWCMRSMGQLARELRLMALRITAASSPARTRTPRRRWDRYLHRSRNSIAVRCPPPPTSSPTLGLTTTVVRTSATERASMHRIRASPRRRTGSMTGRTSGFAARCDAISFRARRSNCLPRTYGRDIYALLDIQSASFASCAVVGSIVSSW